VDRRASGTSAVAFWILPKRETDIRYSLPKENVRPGVPSNSRHEFNEPSLDWLRMVSMA